ncbi:MAG: hypothetical protein IKV80_07125 [Bacteroidales bacterium]|nr:hypothetical protein [Bacteroidales bacterium]
MKYYLFDTKNECLGTATDVNTALQCFGEIYDSAGKGRDKFCVEVYIQAGTKEKLFNTYELPVFLNMSPEAFEATPEQEDEHTTHVVKHYGKIDTTLYNALCNAGDAKQFDSMAANFTDEEFSAVLKYVPTGFIIGELARRLEEYESVTNEIQHTLNNMKIYTSDKKGN